MPLQNCISLCRGLFWLSAFFRLCGVNIRQVQAGLGHSEIETTQKYLHYLTDADAEAANILTNMIEEPEEHTIDIRIAQ